MNLPDIGQIYYTEGFERSCWEMHVSLSYLDFPTTMENQGVTEDFLATWSISWKIVRYWRFFCSSLVFEIDFLPNWWWILELGGSTGWSKRMKRKLMCERPAIGLGMQICQATSYLTTEGHCGSTANHFSDNKGCGPQFIVPWIMTPIFFVSRHFPTCQSL